MEEERNKDVLRSENEVRRDELEFENYNYVTKNFES